MSAGAQVVVGASGGLGRAFVEGLIERADGPVYAFSRSAVDLPRCSVAGRLDLTDKGSIAAAVAMIPKPVALAIVATGRLHGEKLTPERNVATLDADALTRNFHVNTNGPALVAKHMAPPMPKDRRAVLALLSAGWQH